LRKATAADWPASTPLVEDEAELVGDEDALAPGEGLPEDALAVPAAVDVGRVEEGHTQVEAAMNGADRFGIIDVAVAHPTVAIPERSANGPAAHTDQAHLETAAADLDRLLGDLERPRGRARRGLSGRTEPQVLVGEAGLTGRFL
jgi:hypothetical protein